MTYEKISYQAWQPKFLVALREFCVNGFAEFEGLVQPMIQTVLSNVSADGSEHKSYVSESVRGPSSPLAEHYIGSATDSVGSFEGSGNQGFRFNNYLDFLLSMYEEKGETMDETISLLSHAVQQNIYWYPNGYVKGEQDSAITFIHHIQKGTLQVSYGFDAIRPRTDFKIRGSKWSRRVTDNVNMAIEKGLVRRDHLLATSNGHQYGLGGNSFFS